MSDEIICVGGPMHGQVLPQHLAESLRAARWFELRPIRVIYKSTCNCPGLSVTHYRLIDSLYGRPWAMCVDLMSREPSALVDAAAAIAGALTEYDSWCTNAG